MARNSSKINRLAIKEMVEGWEGRKLPKNISMKALIDMVADEAEITECEAYAVPVMCDECHVRKEGDHESRGAEAQNG